MKRGLLSLGAAALLLLGGCNKPAEQIPDAKCDDFNNIQVLKADYNDTVSTDMANYFEGSQCTFRWKIGAVDCCQNAPLDIVNKITVMADDSISNIRFGYTFDRTGIVNYMDMKKSAPYYTKIYGVRTKVIDITNPVTSFNRCTTCYGADPTPVSTFIEISMPSGGTIDADRALLRERIKAVHMKLNYIYNLD
jgi:hypothetical protein